MTMTYENQESGERFMKTSWMATLVGVVCVVALACGGGDGGGEGEGHEHTGGGEDLSQYEGPVSGDAAAGGEVFANFCAGCHPGVGPDLHGRTDEAAEIRQLVRHGEDRMPAFSADQVSDADLENVLAHLQAEYGMFQ
jgi:mono/diheme cytochrome c family protein